MWLHCFIFIFSFRTAETALLDLMRVLVLAAVVGVTHFSQAVVLVLLHIWVFFSCLYSIGKEKNKTKQSPVHYPINAHLWCSPGTYCRSD